MVYKKNIFSPAILFLIICTMFSCEKAPPTNPSFDPLFSIFIPNIISSDEEYKVFYLRSSHTDVWVEELAIYDTWGKLIFWNEDFPIGQPEYGWDGTVDGEETLSGAYTYSTTMSRNTKQFSYVGDLTKIN